MTEEQRGELIKLAGEMVRGQGMPSPFIVDWGLPKSTTAKARQSVCKAATMANEQSCRWAAAIIDIVKRDRSEATS